MPSLSSNDKQQKGNQYLGRENGTPKAYIPCTLWKLNKIYSSVHSNKLTNLEFLQYIRQGVRIFNK